MANDSMFEVTKPTKDDKNTLELLEGMGWGSPLRVELVDVPGDPDRYQVVITVPKMTGHLVIESLHQNLRKLLRM
jgi:hypothetical protein